MNMVARLVLAWLMLFQASRCLAADSVNLVFLPDPFACHQLGLDARVTERSTLGVLGRSGCHSDRPTYGQPNDAVTNTFGRLLVPWRYSRRGVFRDGFFLQAAVGMEKHEFRSERGSSADVTFADVAFHAGYQWFWSNGVNISILGGAAFLIEQSSTSDISGNERADVVDYLDKNTETNLHGAAGAVFGWAL
jgi:hypothetical protein